MRGLVFTTLVVVASCARPYHDVRLPAKPAPSIPGVEHTTGVFAAGDGTKLFEQRWRPTQKPRAVLVIVHGIKDHSSRYAELAQALARAGYAVHAFDLRGHGRSAGRRSSIKSFDTVLDDIERFLQRVRSRHRGAPLFIMGHSMGAVLVPLLVVERSPAIDGVILSATALRPRVHPFEVAALMVLAKLFPRAPLLNAPNHTFSGDRSVVLGMSRDPLIYQGRGSARMVAALATGVRRVWARVQAFRAPILILHGTADQATNPRGSIALHRRVSSDDKTLRLYRGGQHDLAHDPLRARVQRDIRAWLDRHSEPEAAHSSAERSTRKTKRAPIPSLRLQTASAPGS